MLGWIHRTAGSLRAWWARRRRQTRFEGVAVCASHEDPSEEIRARKLVLVGTADRPKWLRFACPCRCGEMLSLNLMAGHRPRWAVKAHDDGTISVSPSVDATACGSHFWIRGNRIDWCSTF
jgi:hypothetical protein